MAKETHQYTNDEITVIWKPKVCIHSTICWKGLMAVFNPKERPWIKMAGASTEMIIEQVRKCPSGALSYFYNKEKSGVDNMIPEAAGPLKVTVTPNGPYLINSACLITHSDGREERKNGTVALCRCGSSHNKPYCDGSHRKIAFTG